MSCFLLNILKFQSLERFQMTFENSEIPTPLYFGGIPGYFHLVCEFRNYPDMKSLNSSKETYPKFIFF